MKNSIFQAKPIDSFLNSLNPKGIMSYNGFIITILGLVLLSSLASAATLKGSVYNSNLELESNVLMIVDSTPQQKYLAKEGIYSFELPIGEYSLTAKSKQYIVIEEVEIISGEGEYLLDVFLLPNFLEEDELWKETENIVVDDGSKVSVWSYLIAVLIVIYGVTRIIRARKKYGPLNVFRKKMKQESQKTVEQHREELAQEPGYLDNVIEIIKKHDGRISQKELRKEMLYLSEGKISLIITELEHKEKIEKIKKGRGNVIILK